MIFVHVLSVLLNLDTCSVVSDSQKDNRSPDQLAGLWAYVCGKLAPCPDHPNAQLQVKPEVRLIAQQKPPIPAAGCADQLKISAKTRQRCVKRRGRIRWVLTRAIAAYRADLGSRPSCALKECPVLGKIYENYAFTRFRCEPVDFIEEKNSEKVIHKHTFLGANPPQSPGNLAGYRLPR